MDGNLKGMAVKLLAKIMMTMRGYSRCWKTFLILCY